MRKKEKSPEVEGGKTVFSSFSSPNALSDFNIRGLSSALGALEDC
jgi:hypothetical protein